MLVGGCPEGTRFGVGEVGFGVEKADGAVGVLMVPGGVHEHHVEICLDAGQDGVIDGRAKVFDGPFGGGEFDEVVGLGGGVGEVVGAAFLLLRTGDDSTPFMSLTNHLEK